MSEAWTTDEALKAARERFIARIPGFVMPAAYSVARKDSGYLTFGQVNPPGGRHLLPVAALALACGYVDTTMVRELTHDGLAEVCRMLGPAEAAVHLPHPNLWSWRTLLAEANEKSTFLAFFLVDPAEPPSTTDDEEFRRLLTP